MALGSLPAHQQVAGEDVAAEPINFRKIISPDLADVLFQIENVHVLFLVIYAAAEKSWRESVGQLIANRIAGGLQTMRGTANKILARERRSVD